MELVGLMKQLDYPVPGKIELKKLDRKMGEAIEEPPTKKTQLKARSSTQGNMIPEKS